MNIIKKRLLFIVVVSFLTFFIAVLLRNRFPNTKVYTVRIYFQDGTKGDIGIECVALFGEPKLDVAFNNGSDCVEVSAGYFDKEVIACHAKAFTILDDQTNIVYK